MFNFFTTNEIKPTGWLKRALEVQANGLNGNLDKMWPDVRDSKWIGGDKEGWERVPYWLDGFVPLAYLLNDEDMINRAKKYIDKIIENQTETGWICPIDESKGDTYDMWGLFIILKALVVYADCSNDDRIEEVVYKALKSLKGYLRWRTLANWANSRWYECVYVIAWLYKRRKEEWLVGLAKYLRVNNLNIKESTIFWGEPYEEWNHFSHVVNVAMCLKAECLYKTLITGEQQNGDDARQLLDILEKNHGTATGHFTGSEILAGPFNNQGTELCGVVEAMFSYENLLQLTEETEWADRLEFLAFNAYPAQVSDDTWTHQYLQMVNQVGCYILEKNGHYTTNSTESNCFGLETNFGCCTANFGQGLPKFTTSTFMYKGSEVYNTALAPSALNCTLDGNKIGVTITTDYPFENLLSYEITCDKSFDFNIRIPSWAKEYKINGKLFARENGWHKLSVKNGDKITLELLATPKLNKRPNGLYALTYGALLFAVPIQQKTVMHEFIRDGVERKFPYCDYEFFPAENWGYAFKMDGFNDTVVSENLPCEIIFNKNYANPFSREVPPIKIKLPLYTINWESVDGFKYIAKDCPTNTTPTGETVKELVPYGCTYLRMTELPMASK